MLDRNFSRPARLGLLLITLTASLATCSDGKELTPAAGDVGQLALAIEIAPGVTVSQMDYRVLKDGVVVITGTADTREMVFIQLSALPSGAGYTVELSATTSQGLVCTGSAPFTVAAQASIVVPVPMTCGLPSRGDARIAPEFSGCNRVRVLSATDLPGRHLAVSVVASSDAIAPTFLWSSSDGTFDSTTVAQTVFHCGATAGTARITVTVADATCGDTVSTDVNCGPPDVLPGCGDGTVGPGETCDALGLPTATCDETCSPLPNACGSCVDMNCPADIAGCSGLTGTERRTCQALVACAHASTCASGGDGMPCYCGTADVGGCLGGAANGACKALVEAAAGTTDPQVIGERFTDPSYLLGRAMNFFGCRAAFCPAECAPAASAPSGP
jgi:hypothetical protein